MPTLTTSEQKKDHQAKPFPMRQAVLGFGWFGVGVLGIIIALVTLDSDATLSTNPRFWPVMCALIMAASGFGIGVQNLLGLKQEASAAQAEEALELAQTASSSEHTVSDVPEGPVAPEEDDDSPTQEPVVRRWGHIYLFVALFIYVLVMPEIGYVLASFMLLAACLWIIGFRSFWKGPLIAAILATGTAYLFGNLLGVALPRGSGVLRTLDGIFF